MPRLNGFVCASISALFYAPLALSQEVEDPPEISEPPPPPEEETTIGLSLPPSNNEKKESTGSFSVGAGFSSQEGFIATTQVAQNNLFGTGYQLSLDASLSSQRQDLFLRFAAPHIGEKDGTVSIEVGTSLRFYQNGLTQQWNGGRISWKRALDDNWSLVLSGTVADSEATAAQPFFPQKLLAGGLSTMGSVGLTYRALDDPEKPRAEFIQSLRVDLSKNVERADGGFFRIEKDVSYAFSLKKGAELNEGPTLKFGIGLGYMSGLTPGAEVAVVDRFFVGGEDSVRGFAPGTLGPQLKVLGGPSEASSAIAIGGLGKAVFRSELSVPMIKKMGLHGLVFFDAGNTFGGISGKDSGLFLSHEKDFGVIPLRTAAGVGLRWESPIGPLNFTLGVPLDRRPGEAPVLFQFSIGR